VTEITNDKASFLRSVLVKLQTAFITFEHDWKRPQIFVVPFAGCHSNLVLQYTKDLELTALNCEELVSSHDTGRKVRN
jgi:hypothetical protein